MADHVVTEKSAFAYGNGGVTGGSRHKNFSFEVCGYEVCHVSLIGPCPRGIKLFCALKQPEKTYLFEKYIGLIARTPDFWASLPVVPVKRKNGVEYERKRLVSENYKPSVGCSG